MLRTSATDVSVTEARDRIVKKLNRLKTDGNKITIRAIALDAWQIADALGEAKQKNCQYVLTSHLTSLLSQEKLMSDLQTYETVTTANVEYEVYGVESRAQYAKGEKSAGDTTSHRDVVRQVIDLMARDVATDLMHGPMPSPPPAVQEAQSELQISPHMKWVGEDECGWLPGNLEHRDALHGACEFALSLKQRMPNFMCSQETSRYLADENVPRDLISAVLRYQGGEESFSEVKVNGKAVAEKDAHSVGLWSKGQFGGDLRAIFDSANKPVFEYSGEKEAGSYRAWVFHYRIAKQNDPLWVLQGPDGMLAPAYSGELWLDQKTGSVVRFRSAAENIPLSFAMQSAELAIDYQSVSFADGSEFMLPADSTIRTTYRGEDATRNVMKFENCHKFRAQARMVLQADSGGPGTAERNGSGDATKSDLERNQEIYEILRAEAIREDDQRRAVEQTQELEAATQKAVAKLDALEKRREEEFAKLQREKAQPDAESATTALTAPPAPGAMSITVEVNLVPVSVVTRDTKGRAVGSLARQNFQLFDERQLQTITRFSVENNDADKEPATTTEAESNGAEARATAPDRSVAYVFDDLHANLEDLEKAKKAALKTLGELPKGERVAIFATSGKVALDFTDSQELLQGALRALRPNGRGGESCPPMNYYEADLIVNQGDASVRDMATGDALACMFKGGNVDRGQTNIAGRTAFATAVQMVENGREESERALQVLRQVIAKTSARSGRRSMVVISQGFPTLTPESQAATMDLIEYALRSDIVVNTLDVTGLEAESIAENGGFSSPADRMQFNTQEQMARTGVMADLAYGTGGVFFHNNNDLSDGFRRAADAPKYMYVLGFSPQRLDGKFHKLKVMVKGPQKLTVQARPGYYALKPSGS
jgi:VWFA-related protein